jgi:hypothetical protein
VDPQSMPSGALDTVPVPVPALLMVSFSMSTVGMRSWGTPASESQH